MVGLAAGIVSLGAKPGRMSKDVWMLWTAAPRKCQTGSMRLFRFPFMMVSQELMGFPYGARDASGETRLDIIGGNVDG